MSEPTGVIQFSEAKATLSGVVDSVVRRHMPVVIERNHRKEAVLVVNTEDMVTALQAPYASMFEPQVLIEGGAYSVTIEKFGLYGVGASLEDALEDLLSVLEEYSKKYFRELEYYRRTPNREGHFLPLLLFRASAPDQKRRLLQAAPESAAVA